ncbi:MAG: DUF3999 domain-containing protein [Desulforhopalus sp.]
MRYFHILVIFSLCPGQVMAEDITARDFAKGYYLEVDNTTAVHSLELPEEVYHTVQSADLRDVRVFNGAGEVIPHDFRTVKVGSTELREKRSIPFFPLFQVDSLSDPEGFSLQVSRDTAGAIVNITSNPASDTVDRKITGYLLDLSKLKRTASDLDFQWVKESDSSVFTVNVQQSNDLVRWIPLVHKATLADLKFGGQQVARRTVHLPRQPLKYLKLTWQESRWPLRLTDVTSFSHVLEARRKRRWISLDNGTVLEKNDRLTVDFATNSRLPVSSVQIRFPETNSIANLSIQSRPDDDTGWKTRCEQVFHHLTFNGAAIHSEPCSFPMTTDHLWRVVVRQDGAGLRSDSRMITMQLGWQPNELIFIGRGTPPYLLAFGSGKLAQKEKNAGDGMVLQAIKTESSAQVVDVAQLGKSISLGGDSALRSPSQPPPWKQWFLWAVLVLGVALLAFMARSLNREIKSAEQKEVSDD